MKRELKAVDKIPYGYDRRLFKLDGRMNLNIRFNDRDLYTSLHQANYCWQRDFAVNVQLLKKPCKKPQEIEDAQTERSLV